MNKSVVYFRKKCRSAEASQFQQKIVLTLKGDDEWLGGAYL